MVLCLNFSYAVNSLGGPTLPMDCDTGQEILQGMRGEIGFVETPVSFSGDTTNCFY